MLQWKEQVLEIMEYKIGEKVILNYSKDSDCQYVGQIGIVSDIDKSGNILPYEIMFMKGNWWCRAEEISPPTKLHKVLK